MQRRAFIRECKRLRARRQRWIRYAKRMGIVLAAAAVIAVLLLVKEEPQTAEAVVMPAVEVACQDCPKAQQPEPEPEAEVIVVIPEEKEPVVAFVTYQVPLEQDLQDHIIAECEKHSIDPAIIFAMIDRESDFQADCIGDGGDSEGLMQIQKKWHSDRMDKLGCTDLLDPYQNTTVGIDLLAELIGRNKGIEWALMAYNGGATYANKKVQQAVITDYALEVLENSKILKEGVQMTYTDDPIADFLAWDNKQESWLQKLPVCVDCEQPIQQDTAVYINDEWLCDECLDSYRRAVLPE